MAVGLGRQYDEVAKLAVGNEDLLAVDDEIVAVAGSAGPDRLEVAAGMRLGHTERSDRFTRHHLGQPSSLLFFGAEGEKIGRDQVGMDQKAGPAGAGPPQLLEDDDVKEVIEPHPAIFPGHRAAEQAGRARLQPQVTRNDAVLFPFGVEGHDLAIDEAPDRLPENFMLFAKERALDHCQNASCLI
jgi:hypothetical protein